MIAQKEQIFLGDYFGKKKLSFANQFDSVRDQSSQS